MVLKYVCMYIFMGYVMEFPWMAQVDHQFLLNRLVHHTFIVWSLLSGHDAPWNHC